MGDKNTPWKVRLQVACDKCFSYGKIHFASQSILAIVAGIRALIAYLVHIGGGKMYSRYLLSCMICICLTTPGRDLVIRHRSTLSNFCRSCCKRSILDESA